MLAAKPADAQVFETLNAGDLNNALKELMDGLSVKVFRTYNASITLDRLLFKESVSQTVDEKKADYDRANKEVCFPVCRNEHTSKECNPCPSRKSKEAFCTFFWTFNRLPFDICHLAMAGRLHTSRGALRSTLVFKDCFSLAATWCLL